MIRSRLDVVHASEGQVAGQVVGFIDKGAFWQGDTTHTRPAPA